MLLGVYFLNAVISFAAVIYYFETTLNKVNQKQVLSLVVSAMASWVYCFAATSKNFDAYYIAYNIYYTCLVFSLILMVLIIAELCGFKDRKWLRRGLLVFALIIMYLVKNIIHSKLYYTSYSFATSNRISYLIKEYGPLHILLPLFIFGSNAFCMWMTIYSYKKHKASSTFTTSFLLGLLTLSTVIYFSQKIFHIPYEVMPFIFTLIDISFIIIFRRASLYDMSSNLLYVYEQRSEYGYIAFDRKLKYMGASDVCLSLFPELNEIRIDSKITSIKSDVVEKILPWVSEWIDGNRQNLIYSKDKITMSCSVKEIIVEKKHIGYLIEMTDISNQQHKIDSISSYNSQLETTVEEKTRKVLEIQESIISGMAMMVESRDNSTGGHIKRTSECVKIFIEELVKPEYNLNLTERFCRNIIKAAPMHDLGKIAVDDVILRKPGKFEPHEYEKMKKHSEEGAKIVKQVLVNVDDKEFIVIAVNVAHYHHEKWNGQGYPSGLQKNAIPLEARIMAYADVFDALVSKRCYKDSFSFDRAFEIIENDLGKHFDPLLGKAFLKCRPKLEAYYSSLSE